MRNGLNDLGRALDASDGEPYPGLLSSSCPVPSQGEIGSLIAVTAAANLALAHRRDAHRRLARHADATTEQRSN